MLAFAAASPIQGLIRHFRPKVEAWIAKQNGFVQVPASATMLEAAE